jgi:hypothetical protein
MHTGTLALRNPITRQFSTTRVIAAHNKRPALDKTGHEVSGGSLVPSFKPDSVVPRGDLRGFNPPPPPKFQSFDKAEPNSHFRGKYIRNNLIRTRVSPICKLSGTPD